MMSDSEFTKLKLEQNPLLRHLFNKINSEVVVRFADYKIKGLLKTINVGDKYIEVEEEHQVHYINMRECLEIVTQKTVEKQTQDRF